MRGALAPGFANLVENCEACEVEVNPSTALRRPAGLPVRVRWNG